MGDGLERSMGAEPPICSLPLPLGERERERASSLPLGEREIKRERKGKLQLSSISSSPLVCQGMHKPHYTARRQLNSFIENLNLEAMQGKSTQKTTTTINCDWSHEIYLVISLMNLSADI